MKTLMIMAALISAASCTQFASDTDTYDSAVLFDCLGHDTAVEPRGGARVTYVTPVVDFDTQLSAPTAVPAAVLTVCTSAACDVPFTDWQRLPGPSPAVWVLSFPFGLRNAVLRFTAEGYAPMDYVLGGPMIGSADGSLEVHGIGVPLVSTATYASLHAQVGVAADPLAGSFAARVLDCDGNRAARTSVEPLDASGGIDFALSNGNLASGTKHVTDDRGVAGYLNLPAQNFDVAAIASFGETIAATTVQIRPGVVTLAELRPGLEMWGQ